MPKVSVIMGVYNVGDKKFLQEAVNSVLAQSFTDFEFIICDDGSKDSTLDIVYELVNNDSRCKIIKNDKNMGLASTLNKCIEIAKGEYIARMDADDRSLVNRFEKQVEYLERNPDVAVIGTQAYIINNDGIRYKEFKRKRSVSLLDTVKNSNIIHPSSMIRRKVLNEVGNYTVSKLTTRAEDYDLWCKIASKGYKIENLEEFLFEYREDKDSYKKRKYKHRIEEYKLKKYWIKRTANLRYIIYAYKPLIVGLIPTSIMFKRKLDKTN